MGIYFFLTTREKTMILGVVGLLVVVVIVSGIFVMTSRLAPERPENPEFVSNLTDLLLSLEMKPQIIEKEVFVHVPASYLDVNGRNYTSTDVLALLEVKGTHFISFEKWVNQLFTIAEGQMSFQFNGLVYGPGEYEVEDVEPDECIVEFEHAGFDEGVLHCGDVEMETEDSLDLQCSVEIFFERDSKYEHGKIKSCDLDQA
jgi:hypothetical protein